jgi:hypothetical protein
MNNERQVTGYEMTPGTSATLKDLLKVAMGDSRKMYVIIDGLDECEKSERSKVLAWLGSVTTADGDPTIKMAAFSTDEPDIKRKLSKFLEKRLETGDIEEDLQIYLKLQVVELKEKFELLDAISEPTIQTILERAKS